MAAENRKKYSTAWKVSEECSFCFTALNRTTDCWNWKISLKSSTPLRHLCACYLSLIQLEILLTGEKIKLVLIMNSTTNTLIHSTPISDMSNSYSSCNVFLATETRKDIKFPCNEIKWTEYFDSVAKLDVYVMYMRFLMSILEITSQILNTHLHTVITSKFSINVKWNSLKHINTTFVAEGPCAFQQLRFFGTEASYLTVFPTPTGAIKSQNICINFINWTWG